MDVKDAAGQGPQGSEEGGRERIYHLREDLNHHKQNVVKNNTKGAAGEGDEKHVMENWSKEDPWYRVLEA